MENTTQVELSEDQYHQIKNEIIRLLNCADRKSNTGRIDSLKGVQQAIENGWCNGNIFRNLRCEVRLEDGLFIYSVGNVLFTIHTLFQSSEYSFNLKASNYNEKCEEYESFAILPTEIVPSKEFQKTLEIFYNKFIDHFRV